MSIIYEMPKLASLALGDYQIIPTSLYLAKIVNAPLSMIDNCDTESTNSLELLEARRMKLKQELNQVTDLYSTLNHYAGHPGIDKMIQDLGWNNIYIL